MESVPNFDKHSHISYKGLQQLYWSEFSHRVSICLNAEKRRRIRTDKGRAFALAELFNQVDFADSDAVYRSNKFGHNFFFSDERQAAQFIDRNAALISEVVRPEPNDDLHTLTDPSVSYRDKGFFGLYGWRITLTADEDAVQPALTYIRERFYEEDGMRFNTGRHPRMHFCGKRLYLRDELDVLLVRLGVDEELLVGIDRVIVRNG